MQFVEEMAKISKSSIWTTWLKVVNIIFHSCVCKCNVHGNFQGGATMDLLEWELVICLSWNIILLWMVVVFCYLD
ncbi:unnamed protein product [Sphagnum balticum]